MMEWEASVSPYSKKGAVEMKTLIIVGLLILAVAGTVNATPLGLGSISFGPPDAGSGSITFGPPPVVELGSFDPVIEIPVIGSTLSFGSMTLWSPPFIPISPGTESFDPVPEPATIFLLGGGLLALGIYARRLLKQRRGVNRICQKGA